MEVSSSSTLDKKSAMIRNKAVRLVKEATKRENSKPAHQPAKPPPPTQPPAQTQTVQSTELTLFELNDAIDGGDYHYVKNTPSVDELARQSRREDSKVIRDSNREKKLAAFRSKPIAGTSKLQKAAAGATIVATFPSGQPCTKVQLDTIVSLWAKERKMTSEQADQYLVKEFDVQQFVNEFAGLLNNKSEAWKEQEQEISFSKDSTIATDEQVDGFEDI